MLSYSKVAKTWLWGHQGSQGSLVVSFFLLLSSQTTGQTSRWLWPLTFQLLYLQILAFITPPLRSLSPPDCFPVISSLPCTGPLILPCLPLSLISPQYEQHQVLTVLIRRCNLQSQLNVFLLFPPRLRVPSHRTREQPADLWKVWKLTLTFDAFRQKCVCCAGG